MPRKRKINLPLIEVIGISLALHILALVVLGGVTIYKVLSQPEPEFDAPPPMEQVDTQKLQMQVRLQQQQQQSTAPVQPISVANISSMNMPSLDVDMPTINPRVAIGAGQAGAGAGGMGRSFGRDGIDMSRSAVNFFGITSSGERIMFIIDATDYMLEDKKGGIPAYNIIKQDVSRMVDELSPGTLFNVMFYRGGSVQAFSPTMLAATRENKDRIIKWIEPINKDYASRGNVRGNVNLERKDIQPMENHPSQWVKALQIAMEQGADAIFLLVSAWQWHGVSFENDAERDRWYAARKWGPSEEEAWQKAVADARAWLAEENKARKARGVPERVVHSMHTLVAELYPRVRRKPAPSFSADDVAQHINTARRLLYRERDYHPPPINVVLFLGKDEETRGNSHVERFNDIARKNRGRFRVLQGMEALQNVTRRASDTQS